MSHRKRRKKNKTILQSLGFVSARPTKAELMKSRREFKARVKTKSKAIQTEYKRLRQSARSGFKDKGKLEALFHEVYGQNPRQLPEVERRDVLERFERLIKGNAMAQKKKRSKKKKRNPRKGVMPPGLRKYWAKKRAKKNGSRKRKKRNPRRTRTITKTVVKYRYRKPPKRKRARRRKANPSLRRAKRINLKGFTASQIKRVASAIRSATGKRVRVVRP
jgi:hypothetical protein